MRAALVWGLRRIGLGTLLTLALLLMTAAIVAQGIATLVKSLDAPLLFITVVVGTLTSWLLAKSRVRGIVAGVLILLLGVAVIVIQVGQLGGKFAALLQALWAIEQQIRYTALTAPIDWSPLTVALSELGANLVTLYLRVVEWLQSLLSSKPVFDPVAAAIVWSLALWAVATQAAWAVRRHYQSLQALLPALALLTAAFAYTGGDALILILPLAALLVLMVVVSHRARERSWAVRGIDYSEDVRLDMVIVVVPICTLLILTAWFVPSISLERIAALVEQAMSEPAKQAQPLPDSLGLQPRPKPKSVVATDALRAPGMPRSHLIGSGPELSREVVMVISTGDLPPMPQTLPQASGLPIQPPPRYYWRSSTYDRYIGGGWQTGEPNVIAYRAAQQAISITIEAQRVVRQQVKLNADVSGLVYVAGTLLSADQDYRVAWRANQDAFNVRFAEQPDSYRADSLISVATEEQLRSVRPNYPDEVRDRYLQLPAQMPERVLSLARDLTATGRTPYDRAVAIEAYLRTYSYTLDLPAPLAGRDVVDYFLFDLKRGYCDYFSASMVVLARAAGLPARLVVGYASGTYDAMNAQYVVTQADAHSWPEIYFNEYGWVEFEPTSGRAAIDRPSALKQGTGTGGSSSTLEPLQPARRWLDEVAAIAPAALLALLVLGPLAWLYLDIMRLQRMSPVAAMGNVFARLRAHGRRLGASIHTGDTPFEYATSLARRMGDLAPKRQRQHVASASAQELSQLTDLYVRAAYSPYQPDDIDRWQALQLWQRLRLRLWLAWLWKPVQRMQRLWEQLRRTRR